MIRNLVGSTVVREREHLPRTAPQEWCSSSDGDPTSFTKFQNAVKATKLDSTVPNDASPLPPTATSSLATDTATCGTATTVTVTKTVMPMYPEPPSYTQSSSYSEKPWSSETPSYTVSSSYTEKPWNSETPSYAETPTYKDTPSCSENHHRTRESRRMGSIESASVKRYSFTHRL